MQDLSPISASDGSTAVTLDTISAETSTAARFADRSAGRIRRITSQMTMLALNAKIESAKAGASGRGFSVVADEVRSVSDEINTIAQDIQSDLTRRLTALNDMVAQLERSAQGERLVDLAFGMVDVMDRNLYERTCDVRWWASEPAFADCLTNPAEAQRRTATRRLGVILDAYTVYMDIWLCDLSGTIIASGRPDRFPVIGRSIADLPFFGQALDGTGRDDFVPGTVVTSRLLTGCRTISYAAPVREGGEASGKPLGVLVTNFDWEPQAASVLRTARLSDAGRPMRLMLIDAQNRVIAASDNEGFLTEVIAIPADMDPDRGYFSTDDRLVAYHRTQGFETYAGLGWRGVVVQDLR